MPPGAARVHGLAFVHQHLGLVPSLTVLENLLIGDDRRREPLARRLGARGARRPRDLRALRPRHRSRWRASQDLPQVERALVAIVRAFEDIRLNAD